MRQQTTPIDWNYWKHMPEVSQWEACALSLDINPSDMQTHPQAWMSGSGRPMFKESSFPSKVTQNNFEMRMRLLEANVFKSPLFKTVNGLVIGARYKATISLNEFAEWCYSIELDVPHELLALRGNNNTISIKQTNPKKEDEEIVKKSITIEDEITRNRKAFIIERKSRGFKLYILESWNEIEMHYGSSPQARQVQRKLKSLYPDESCELKTIQNHLIELRKEKLIP